MKKETILVVDDTVANIDILTKILQDYDVIAVTSGSEALETLRSEKVELILLDIMMPLMDGYEVCQQVKSHSKYKETPIIFITAKTMEEDIKKGFDLGAVDYITKPFNPSELLARVKTHLELSSYKNFLEARVNEEIQKNLIGQQLLFQHSKQAAIGELLMHIAHQWKQPLSELSAVNIFIRNKLDIGHNFENSEIDQNSQKISKIVDFMSKTIETFQNFYTPLNEEKEFLIAQAIEEASNIVSATYQFYEIKLSIQHSANPKAFGNANEYAQVVLNLLNNAKDILIQNKISNPEVVITIATQGKKSCVSICDNGGGFDTQTLQKLFTPHSSGTNSTGLGLYMSKSIIEKNLGKLKVENSKNGAKVTIVL